MANLTPEEEQRRFRIPERDKLERQHAPKIERALRTQVDALVNDDLSLFDIAAAPNRVDGQSAELEAALLAFMLAMSAVSVDAAQDDIAAFALAVDPAEANELTQQLARARTAVALGLLNETTRRALRNALPTWLSNPERTVSDLLKELEPQMNRERADTITRTEATEVFSSGVDAVGGATAAIVGATSLVVAEWYTMEDERVCVVCFPMHGKQRPINGLYSAELPVQKPPAAHPKCRCGERVVIRSIET